MAISSVLKTRVFDIKFANEWQKLEMDELRKGQAGFQLIGNQPVVLTIIARAVSTLRAQSLRCATKSAMNCDVYDAL
jgi:hypothetical protein